MSRTPLYRKAFTLFEVVLALAILLGAMAVMSKLIATGSRAALRAQLQTRAMLLCQSKLSEVVAGVEPLAAVSGVSFDATAPGWLWSLDVAPGPLEDLLEIRVDVQLPGEGEYPRAQASLVRWMRDPQLFEAETATVNNLSPTHPGV